MVRPLSLPTAVIHRHTVIIGFVSVSDNACSRISGMSEWRDGLRELSIQSGLIQRCHIPLDLCLFSVGISLPPHLNREVR